MFIYNITIKVESNIHQEWLAWMDQVYTPAMMDTGKFERHQLLRLREIDDSDGPTYALQLFLESKAGYNAYKAIHEAKINRLQHDAWGDKMLCFSTLMEIVH